MSRTKKSHTDIHLKIVKEIGDLLSSPAEKRSVLKSVVDHLARTLDYDVVSIYLWDARQGALVMTANHGLQFDTENPPQLSPKEGLTGMVFELEQPLSVTPASKHPRYKYFPNLGEQLYETYVGAPIMLKRKCLGVLNVQSREEQEQNQARETLLEIVASRIAAVIEVGGRLDRIESSGSSGKGGPFRQGVGVASGIAYGPVHKLEGLYKTLKGRELAYKTVLEETDRLVRACESVDKELDEVLRALMTDARMSESELGIFKAQRQLLSDPMFQEGVRSRILQGDIATEGAVQEIVEMLCRQFAALGPSFFRERLFDLRDIEDKLLRFLLRDRGEPVAPADIVNGSILLAHEVGPTHLLSLSGSLKAVVTEVGGEGGHMAILARSLGIPAITGIQGVLDLLKTGDPILVDGRTGFLFVNPMDALVRDYDQYRKKQEEIRDHLREGGRDLDGALFPVQVSANIGFPGDLRSAVAAGIDEIGLLRTEFSFMQRSTWPSVEEQFALIEETAKSISGEITIRTLDIGSDKQLPYFTMPREENPMLGLRSIRFSMENAGTLTDQLTAILKAWKQGYKVRILLPMVTQLWEVVNVRNMIENIASDLGLAPKNRPPFGMMLEVPGVLWQLDDYMPYVDFLSFGTNDLVQYLLCVDRNSSHVGHLYCEHHPVVVRFMAQVQTIVEKAGKSITVCGEMAGSPIGILILLSLGFRKLSVVPQRAYVVRYIAKRLDQATLNRIREFILTESNSNFIQSFLTRELEKIHPDLVSVD